MRHPRVVALGIGALLALWSLVVLSGADASVGVAASPTSALNHADLDGDKLFEALEGRLARAASSERVDVIVQLRGRSTRARIRELELAHGAFSVKHRFSKINGFSSRLTKAQILAMRRLDDVLLIEENVRVFPANGLAQASVGATQARVDADVDGDGDGDPAVYSKDDLVAAIVDSGIDAGHGDLDGGKVIAFRDVVSGVHVPHDSCGHGTHVAGIAAGEGDARTDHLYSGVAPAAALVGVKVLNSGCAGTLADVAAGIDWVIANKDQYGIEVVNVSLATSSCSDGTDVASAAANAAVAAGLVVVAAAGNAGPGTCTVGAPGAAVDAITAGAMADLDDGGFWQPDFSSRGPTADGRVKPDISAPGVNITAPSAGTSAGYGIESGTSMASAFVTGVALLMLDGNPSLTPAAVKERLAYTAIEWARQGDNRTPGMAGADIDYGAGRLDAYAAIEMAAGRDIGVPGRAPPHTTFEGSVAGVAGFVDFPISVVASDFPLAATLLTTDMLDGSSTTINLALELFAPGGSLLLATSSSKRSEALTYAPTVAGIYTLRVTSTAGAAAFAIDVSAPLASAPSPPVPVSDPTLIGAASVGASLTVTAGSWDGAPPIDVVYQWRRCDVGGFSCTDIPAASQPTYTIEEPDRGFTLRAAVTARNAAGAATSTSAASALVSPDLPINTVAPSLSESTWKGEVIVASAGTWVGASSDYAYQWQRCGSGGSSCENIPAATGRSYLLKETDVGETTRAVITASNGLGSVSAASLQSALVLAGPPVALSVPSIAGVVAIGETVSATEGSWAGTAPRVHTWQWQRCTPTAPLTCTDITGRTSSRYPITSADGTSRLRVAVTSTNEEGLLVAYSAVTTEIPGATADTKSDPASDVMIADLRPTTMRRVMIGTRGRDVLRGSPGADMFRGLAGADRIRAGRGHDEAFGGTGDDAIHGGKGRDVLIGGPGRDRLDGGPGADVVKARDGRRDLITCGTGHDVVYADLVDRVATSCEHVLIA